MDQMIYQSVIRTNEFRKTQVTITTAKIVMKTQEPPKVATLSAILPLVVVYQWLYRYHSGCGKDWINKGGQSIVTDNEDFTMKGQILKFLVATDVTALYWDVIGEISIAVEVKRPTVGTPVLLALIAVIM